MGSDCNLITSSSKRHSALVLFSGGQDSTVCLAWALEQFDYVETLGFAYGQRHHVELVCRQVLRKKIQNIRPHWNSRLGKDHVLSLDALQQVSETALIQDKDIALVNNGIPNTFVPGRNILFLTFAAVLAWHKTMRHIITGVCETDYSGYPDCRDDSIKAMQVAINLGMDSKYVLHTPLMWLSKADVWHLAEKIGGIEFVNLVNQDSHSCYVGDREHRHVWGYGCDCCPACKLRKSGWVSYQESRKNA